MPSYYLQPSWPNFTLDGQLYDLSHLNEHHLQAEDDNGYTRQILVTFSDHCFTRDRLPSDPEKLIYPKSSRRAGCFSLERYKQSLHLVAHLENAKTRPVWNLGRDVLALLPVVLHDGAKAHYMIVFGLRKLKSRPPFELHMEVKSAYLYTDSYAELSTYGEVGFRQLLSLSIAGRALKRNVSQHRRRPKPP